MRIFLNLILQGIMAGEVLAVKVWTLILKVSALYSSVCRSRRVKTPGWLCRQAHLAFSKNAGWHDCIKLAADDPAEAADAAGKLAHWLIGER
jgi:hypothetical protein